MMKLAEGWRKLASGSLVLFEGGVAHKANSTCSWLVERPNPNFANPDWYPDFPSDVHVVEECGADAVEFEAGGFECQAGHAMGSLEDELGPFGNEWQREQAER
jgi:hypothetical protein